MHRIGTAAALLFAGAALVSTTAACGSVAADPAPQKPAPQKPDGRQTVVGEWKLLRLTDHGRTVDLGKGGAPKATFYAHEAVVDGDCNAHDLTYSAGRDQLRVKAGPTTAVACLPPAPLEDAVFDVFGDGVVPYSISGSTLTFERGRYILAYERTATTPTPDPPRMSSRSS